jgi:hypothetical protein
LSTNVREEESGIKIVLKQRSNIELPWHEPEFKHKLNIEQPRLKHEHNVVGRLRHASDIGFLFSLVYSHPTTSTVKAAETVYLSTM